jgi:hypothetical protein
LEAGLGLAWTLKGGHFDPYVADFEAASAAARDWFVEHLSG